MTDNGRVFELGAVKFVLEKADEMGDMRKGQCFCGKVRFSYPTEKAAGAVACHCRDCQQMHGNYNAMAAVDRDALDIQDDGSLNWFASSEKVRRGFCSNCGGRLFKDNLGSPKMMVSMGVIDPPTGLRIARNIWTESKGDWYDIPPVS